MRALLIAVAAVATLSSGPVAANPPHGFYVRPYVGFGLGYGYPFYGPYYSPWFYGPAVGVGIHLGNASRPKGERAEPAEQQALKLFVYPAAGQSESQTAEDRYQCHVWSAGQSGHDPTMGAGTREEAEGYTRAFTACMEGRGYVVR
jgi:hypothetical protein